MAIGNGLLNNPVLSGLLGGGGPAAIKAAKDRELAQLRQGIRGRQISAPGAVAPASRESLGTGLSALGSALGDIAKMRKERATRQAIMDSGKPVTTTDRVLVQPQRTVNMPSRFTEPQSMSTGISMSGGPSIDVEARASQMAMGANPNEQRLGGEALRIMQADDGTDPAVEAEVIDDELADTLVTDRNEQVADLLNLQYTPGFQKVIAEKYADEKRSRAPTMDERVNRLLAAGEVGAATKLATIASTQATAKTARIKAEADLEKAKNKDKFVEGSPKQADFILKVEKNHENAKDTVTYREARRSYEAIEGAAKDNSPISDLDLIFGIAKIFDPTSVVRGSEVNAVNEIGGLPQIVYRSVGRLQGNQTLSNETRRQIVAAAKRRITTYEKAYGMRVRKTKAIADRYKLSYDLVGLSQDDRRFFPVQYKFGD